MPTVRATLIAFAVAAVPLAAQSPNMKPFELNMERVSVKKFGGDLGDSKTYFIPTYDLVVSINGSVWAKKGGAQAHGKFFVDGLTPALMHELTTKLHDDLVSRMRAAGYTVHTYSDFRNEPDVVSRKRDNPDDKWGFPTRRGQPLNYLIAAPSEEQQFNNPIQGPVWPWRGIAKEKNLIAISPEITFSVPQMYGETRAGVSTNSAGIAIDPAMKLTGATIYTINGKGGTANITVLEHGMRLASDNAGTITNLSENKTTFSDMWKRASGDWEMTIDPVAFTDGIMRVGLAINSMVVSQLEKAHK